MGIIKSIKNIFSNNISLDVDKVNTMVYSYSLKGGKIKIGCKLNVPENFSCILGFNGKSLDCFSSGEFFLTPATLPECCKKLKIHKTDKNNKIKKAFKAEVYYVSHAIQKLDWKTFEKAELGQKLSGVFTVGAVGNIEYVVSNASKLVDNLLNEFAYLKNGEAEKILNVWISDSVVRTLNKFNFALSEFMLDNPVISENVKTSVSQILSKFGLTIKNFEIKEFILPRKYQKEYKANKKKKNNNLEEQDLQEETNRGQKIENQHSQLNEQIEKIETVSDFEYTPFGDFVIEEVNSMEELPLLTKEELSTNEQTTDIQNENNYENVEFVDLNIDKIIKSDKNKIRCINCGAENEIGEIFCNNCNNKL